MSIWLICYLSFLSLRTMCAFVSRQSCNIRTRFAFIIPHQLSHVSQPLCGWAKGRLDTAISVHCQQLGVYSDTNMELLPFGTATSQGDRTTTHVADLGFSTSCIGTVGALDTALALVGVERADQAVVCQHSHGYLMPKGGIEWSSRWPVCSRTVGVTSIIFELVSWASLCAIETSV